jgi:type I restriction enzyme S subunit
MKRSNELNLPMGWEIKRLGDIAIVSSGNSAPQKKEFFDNGCFPFFRTSDVGKIRKGFISSCVDYLNQDGIKGLKLHKKGTILFPKSGASTFLNHRVLLEIDGYVSSHLATIKGINSISDDRYLLYFLTTFDARNLMQDIAYPSLKTSDIGLISIPLPPLPEQQRIVAILDDAFAKIEKAKANAEQNLKNAKELFESYLQRVFENGIWDEKKILDLCDGKENIVGGPFGSNLKVEHYKSSGIPILRLQNIGKGYFIEKDIKYVSKEKAKELEYHSFQSGDLALAKLGIPIGKTCIIPDDFEFGIVVADVVRIRPNKKKVDYNFLNYFLNTNLSVSQLTGNISGATRPRVNLDDVRNIVIKLPSIKEQETIVQKLNALSTETKKLEAIYDQKINDLEELKKSVLQKAFNGEL